MPPSERTFERAAMMFDAAGNAHRLALLLLLREEGRTVTELAEAAKTAPSLVSQQLSVLREARLVKGSRQGRRVFYALFDAHAEELVDAALLHTRHLSGAAGR